MKLFKINKASKNQFLPLNIVILILLAFFLLTNLDQTSYFSLSAKESIETFEFSEKASENDEQNETEDYLKNRMVWTLESNQHHLFLVYYFKELSKKVYPEIVPPPESLYKQTI